MSGTGMAVERFGEFTLDAANRVLLRGEVPVRVEPKVFECIELLVSRAGELVTRTRLHQTLWPGVSVGDAALRRIIREARKVLGDEGGRQALIRTRPKLGYVFVATVVREPQRDLLIAPASLPPWPFVGREPELAQLRSALANAPKGAGALCFLIGEAGAGKSALLSELKKQVAPGLAHWLVGHCSTDCGAPAFWPWREIAVQLRDRATAGVEPAEERDLARVVPELSRVDRSRGSEPAADAEQRFLACEAYVRYLKRVSVSAPLFIVLEDVHWADEGSVLLLESLGRATRQHSLFVFVSYRPEGVVPGQALSKLLSRLSDRDGTVSVHLNALSVEEIKTLLTRLRCSEFAADTALTLKRLTGGNALFVRQFVTHSLSSGPQGMSERPMSLQHVVLERVGSLPAGTLRLLRMAAVLGRAFSITTLASLTKLDAAGLRKKLEQVLAAGLLVEKSASGWLEFGHELLREALYRALPSEQRHEYHAATLAVFEASPAGVDRSHALALHAFLAGPWVEASRRQALCERAGCEAFEVLAFDRAALHLARAFELLDEATPARAKAELALLLARARWEADEPSETVRHTFLEAAANAREAGSALLLGQAALGCFVGEGSMANLRARRVPSEQTALLDEAFAVLESEEPSPAHAGLKFWLARTRCAIRIAEGDRAGAIDALRAVVQYAEPEHDAWSRALGSSVRYVQALFGGDAELARGYLSEFEGCMDEPSLSARQQIELGLRLLGFSLLLGDRVTYERGAERMERALEALPAPPRVGRFGERLAVYTIVPKVARVTSALIAGDLQRAERDMIAAGELGDRIGTLRARDGDDNELLLWLQLRGYEGRAQELEPVLEARLEKFPGDLWEAAIARAQFAIERGALEHAKEQYRLLAATRFRIPGEGRSLPAKLETRVRMADLCAMLGSAEDALVLYESLLPEADFCIAEGALVSLGAAARPLGELARKLGRHERALGHFERALEINVRFGHRPEIARTRLGLARTLCALRRFREADVQSTAAYEEAKSMGMTPLAELASELSPLRRSR